MLRKGKSKDSEGQRTQFYLRIILGLELVKGIPFTTTRKLWNLLTH
jgi:hypothetical protein